MCPNIQYYDKTLLLLLQDKKRKQKHALKYE